MGPIIILGSAVVAFVIYSYTSWLKGISFWYWAAAFAAAVIFNIVIGLWTAAKLGRVLEKEFWRNALVLLLVLAIGCSIAIYWPHSRLGGGILFIFAVVSWVTMAAREILS